MFFLEYRFFWEKKLNGIFDQAFLGNFLDSTHITIFEWRLCLYRESTIVAVVHAFEDAFIYGEAAEDASSYIHGGLK